MSKITEELMPILKAADMLSGAKKRFFAILSERIVGKDPETITLSQVMMEMVTEDHLSFVSDEEDRLYVVFPNGEKCELPKNVASLFVKNGIKNKIYCEVVLYNKLIRYLNDDEEKAVEDARKHTKLDEKKIVGVITRLENEILKLKDRIKSLKRRSEVIPNSKKENDDKIAQLEMFIVAYQNNIKELKRVIENYKDVQRRKQGVVPTSSSSKKEDEQTRSVKDGTKKDKEKEEDEEKKRNLLIGLLLLGGLSLGAAIALHGCSIDNKSSSNPSDETEKEFDGEMDAIAEETEEETEIDTSDVDQVMYEETFQEIINIMQPGMVSREREDAADGVDYDHEIMGQPYNETYDHTQSEYVEPSADFIERLRQYKEKYQNADYTMYDEMVKEGIILLQEYYELVESTIGLVREHNDTTQEAIDSGVRSYNDYYEKQKVVTTSQEEDLRIHLERVKEFMEALSSDTYNELREGIKSGKYSYDLQEGGVIVIYNNETGTMAYTTIQTIATGKGASELMIALSGEKDLQGGLGV